MGFTIPCPNCGQRDVYEFKFDQEVKSAPGPDDSAETWRHYFYFNENKSGVQEEWWFHSAGCGAWLKVKRNTATNEILEVSLPDPEGEQNHE